MADIIAVDVLFNVYHTLEATNLDRSKECLLYATRQSPVLSLCTDLASISS